jgi:DNA-binding XRE family transcriptional regulator
MSIIKPLKVTKTSVTLSRADFEVLVEAAEDRIDLAASEAFDRDVADRGIGAVLADTLPAAAVRRLIEGDHPVAVWREHRGMTTAALAEAASISASYINEIEKKKKAGSVAAMKKLAAALRVGVDILIP